MYKYVNTFSMDLLTGITVNRYSLYYIQPKKWKNMGTGAHEKHKKRGTCVHEKCKGGGAGQGMVRLEEMGIGMEMGMGMGVTGR